MSQFEWCKKLKDAGFQTRPEEDLTFKTKGGKIIHSGAVNVICKHDPDKCSNPNTCEQVEVPQLDELIEACGDRFTSLRKLKIAGKWEAEADAPNSWGTYGEYPEEAVANLLLKIL